MWANLPQIVAKELPHQLCSAGTSVAVFHTRTGQMRSFALECDHLRLLQDVAKNFRTIFAALAPGGRGELVMIKAASSHNQMDNDDAANPHEDAAPEGTQSVLEKYQKVGVKVGALVSPNKWCCLSCLGFL